MGVAYHKGGNKIVGGPWNHPWHGSQIVNITKVVNICFFSFAIVDVFFLCNLSAHFLRVEDCWLTLQDARTSRIAKNVFLIWKVMEMMCFMVLSSQSVDHFDTQEFVDHPSLQAEEKYFKNVAKIFEKLDTSGWESFLFLVKSPR